MSAPDRDPAARPVRLTRIFALPALLFAVSLTGLVAALLIDGPGDGVAALAAGSGIAVLAWLWAGQRRRRQ